MIDPIIDDYFIADWWLLWDDLFILLPRAYSWEKLLPFLQSASSVTIQLLFCVFLPLSSFSAASGVRYFWYWQDDRIRATEFVLISYCFQIDVVLMLVHISDVLPETCYSRWWCFVSHFAVALFFMISYYWWFPSMPSFVQLLDSIFQAGPLFYCLCDLCLFVRQILRYWILELVVLAFYFNH